MKGVLVLPGTGSAQFAANLIDRPFLRHTVDSMANRGLRDIRIVGPASAVSQARDLLRLGYQWDASMGYCEADSPAQYELLAIAGNTEQCLIASASCLPGLRPAVDPETHSGSIIYGTSGEWTGWALINAEDIASLPRLCHEPEVLSHLQSLPTYAGIAADAEFRCCTAEQIWQAHHDAQESNFSGLSHAGIETKPGVWIARNASVAGSAEITPPVYIGENSRIGAWCMRMGAGAKAHATVDVVTKRLFFTRRLGMKVHEYGVAFVTHAVCRKFFIDTPERIIQ